MTTANSEALPHPLSPEDIAAYDAVQTSAVWWPTSLAWSRLHGDKAVDALNGLVSNNVATLAVGATMYAAALSPKGKLVADMLIVKLDPTTLLVAVERVVAAAWLDLARKYINPRLCKVTDASTSWRSWRVVGAEAAQAREAASDSVAVHDAPAIAGAPQVLVVATTTDSTTNDNIASRFQHLGFKAGTDALWTVLRIESGRPLVGVDMNENTIPQEANLDTLDAISFSKGCYTGQETVARVHFRGHVNKHLRGLLSQTPLPTGAELTDAEGKVVGVVTSSGISPSRGPVALGMVRREIACGGELAVAGGMATVVELPFLPAGEGNTDS